MTEYTATKDALLMAMADVINDSIRRGVTDFVNGQMHVKFFAALESAQSSAEPTSYEAMFRAHTEAMDKRLAEPKPSAGVSSEITEKAYFAYYAAINGGSLGLNAMHHAINAVAPLICAAKDADLAAVIQDNDHKMAEIAFLKENLSRQSDCLKKAYAEVQALRHHDIEAAADRLERIHVVVRDAHGQMYGGCILSSDRRAIARAVLNAPENM